MMNGSYGWMGGGIWTWVVTTLVAVARLVSIVGKPSMPDLHLRGWRQNYIGIS
jgi:hypothetical protein